jgi:hypothetical protein
MAHPMFSERRVYAYAVASEKLAQSVNVKLIPFV